MALGGDRDALVPIEQLHPWSSETTGSFEVVTFPGGHFYFKDDPTPLFRTIESRLTGVGGPTFLGGHVNG